MPKNLLTQAKEHMDEYKKSRDVYKLYEADCKLNQAEDNPEKRELEQRLVELCE